MCDSDEEPPGDFVTGYACVTRIDEDAAEEPTGPLGFHAIQELHDGGVVEVEPEPAPPPPPPATPPASWYASVVAKVAYAAGVVAVLALARWLGVDCIECVLAALR